MKLKYSPDYLRRIRNDVDIGDLLADVLDLPTKISEDYLRFLCPLCSEFNTAVNPSTNLARCFRCQQNFNPIDIVIIVKGLSFLDAVAFLSPLL